MYDNQKYEQQCYDSGHRCVAGVDEVGMGCLAGPVVAAAVVFSRGVVPKGIDDSKRLTAKQREVLDTEIRNVALSTSVAWATVEEIDSLNIFHAAKLAMVRAIEQLNAKPDFLLVDGKHRVALAIPQLCLVQGDHLSASIGAASILAKVYRDRWMRELDTTYPGYFFASHKGYGSIAHRKALQELGPTPLHRKSFSWTRV